MKITVVPAKAGTQKILDARVRGHDVITLLAAILLTACGGGDGGPPPGTGDTRTCFDENPLRNPYFGDLHVHTKYSLDASTQATRVSPHDAYRFALGERIPVQPYDANGNGLRSTQLVRPLDFAADTDHSEFFGETEICTHPEYTGYNSPECQFYRAQPAQAFLVFNAQLAEPSTPDPNNPDNKVISRMPYCGANGQDCLDAAKTPWADIQRAAEAYYDRTQECRFTTLLGYEWTGSPQSNNWHRNVIFRSDTVPALPISYMDAAAPEYLWAGLANQCKHEDGCDALTIPHNSNLGGGTGSSTGIMFQTTKDDGSAFDTAFAQTKQDNEPLAEVIQHKGQSECLNGGASANDELCGFEILPYANLAGNRLQNQNPPNETNFLRYALKLGLQLEQDPSVGVNPFKYGLIGSTDTHIGAPGQVLEDRFPGHGGAGQPNNTMPTGLTDLVEVNPGGLAVIWAEQNTRESLYAAMRRREAYGTSGPRMVVRFFGGADLPSDMCESGQFVQHGYGLGVPMGGDLKNSRTPRFAVWAMKDPGAPGESPEMGLPLQRVQIVKGWVDANGDTQEQVYDVAGNKDNGASVNTDTCETLGSGYANLCTVWTDPSFNAAQPSFYYARVVQNPSCRWQAYQCAAAHATCPRPATLPGQTDTLAGCCDVKYPKSVQERAWTSPIWYRPQ